MSQMMTTPQVQQELILEVHSGPDKGAKYRLMGARATLGRSSDCDIKFSDPKMSRHHATIELTPQGIQISEVSETKTMMVNGTGSRSSIIQPGSKIRIGATQFSLELRTVQNQMAPVESQPMASQSSPGDLNPYQNQDSSQGKSQGRPLGGKKPNNVKIILFIFAGLFLMLVLSDDDKVKKQEVEILTQKKIEAEAAVNKQAREAYKQKLLMRRSESYREAQRAFLQGFRDYENALYNRAKDSFQACLSLDPNHKLCERYIVLANRKFDELVQYKMILGRQYKEQNLFSKCVKEFENVMFMIQDESNRTYMEAKDNKNTCEAFLEGVR